MHRLQSCKFLIASIFLVSTAHADGYEWQSVSADYMDPAAFFAIHGYVNAVFAGKSKEWPQSSAAQIGPPGQVIVPNTANHSFGVDAALFVSSEMSEKTRVAMELHLVGDPSGKGAAGPGGLTLVLTEAVAEWDVVGSYLTLGAGIFWSPFGDLNRDWLSAQNLFSLVPRASSVFPGHVNDRGLRIRGDAELADGWGLNYVVSIANGVQAFSIAGQTPVDLNDNKTIVGRVGLFPGLYEDLQVGISGAYGELRDQGAFTGNAAAAADFPADFHALGLDVRYQGDHIRTRGYTAWSQENLETSSTLTRVGGMGEVEFAAEVSSTDVIDVVAPRLRVDIAKVEELVAGVENASTSFVTSLGVGVRPNDHFELGVGYHILSELTGPNLDNNRFIANLTASF